MRVSSQRYLASVVDKILVDQGDLGWANFGQTAYQHVAVIDLVRRDVLIPARHQLPPLVPRGHKLEEVPGAYDDGPALPRGGRDVVGRYVDLPDVRSTNEGGLEGGRDFDFVDEEAGGVELGQKSGLAGGVVLREAPAGVTYWSSQVR